VELGILDALVVLARLEDEEMNRGVAAAINCLSTWEPNRLEVPFPHPCPGHTSSLSSSSPTFFEFNQHFPILLLDLRSLHVNLGGDVIKRRCNPGETLNMLCGESCGKHRYSFKVSALVCSYPTVGSFSII
jgi:hypothetical protein